MNKLDEEIIDDESLSTADKRTLYELHNAQSEQRCQRGKILAVIITIGLCFNIFVSLYSGLASIILTVIIAVGFYKGYGFAKILALFMYGLDAVLNGLQIILLPTAAAQADAEPPNTALLVLIVVMTAYSVWAFVILLKSRSLSDFLYKQRCG